MTVTIKQEALLISLSKQFKTEIITANYETKPLQGGTVGSVYLVSGNAEAINNVKVPFRIVLKLQKQWERYGDPSSWRREYDLYSTQLEETFLEALRWPTCYYSEMNAEQTEFQLWLEYIDGTTGLNLTADMYEQAAFELGRYQGKLYAEQPSVLHELSNLSHKELMKITYLHYRSWPVVYDYVRSDNCEFPLHVRQMLIDFDDSSDQIFERIQKLPIVLCHRDFWVTNIIHTDDKIVLIDWDTSGWGYLGEDIASLIADEADIDQMIEYYQRCVPAYYRGFSKYGEAPPIEEHCVHELILLMFGYRLVEGYLLSEEDAEKTRCFLILQKIAELKRTSISS